MYRIGHTNPCASFLILSTVHLHVLETRHEVILPVLLKDTSERDLTTRKTVLLKVKLPG